MEGLPALRAAVLSPFPLLVPATLNTASAVTVSAVDGDWLFQKVQTNWTAEVTVVQLDAMFLLLFGHSDDFTGAGRNALKFRFLRHVGGYGGP